MWIPASEDAAVLFGSIATGSGWAYSEERPTWFLTSSAISTGWPSWWQQALLIPTFNAYFVTTIVIALLTPAVGATVAVTVTVWV